MADLFPDVNLKQVVANRLVANTSLTGTALRTELGSLTGTLNANSQGIVDATGIEFLTGITFLRLQNNQLTSIDLSNNTALWALWVQEQGQPNTTVTIPQAVNALRIAQAGNGATHNPGQGNWRWDADTIFVPVP